MPGCEEKLFKASWVGPDTFQMPLYRVEEGGGLKELGDENGRVTGTCWGDIYAHPGGSALHGCCIAQRLCIKGQLFVASI